MTSLKLYPVKREYELPELADPADEVAKLVCDRLKCAPLPPGSSVALAVGSRKLFDIPRIVAQIVAVLKHFRLKPFIVPAMGSHGGATVSGQRELLASLGITEEAVGAPVSAGEVVQLGTSGGLSVFCDKLAWEADAIIPVNRVKPHTAFRAPVESGPSKMVAVGLGRDGSARELHLKGLATAIPEAVNFYLRAGKLAFGVGLIENQASRTAGAALLSPDNWLAEEAALLERAWALYPLLPWDELDLLIVERIGKSISGTSMDLNVIGPCRRFTAYQGGPRIDKVVALDLANAPGGDGNANGVGYADFITAALAEKIDWEKTRLNSEVAGFPQAGQRPEVPGGEEETIRAAVEALPPELRATNKIRAVRIADTLSLTNLLVSRALLKELPHPFHRL